jgi:hypothetical protein
MRETRNTNTVLLRKPIGNLADGECGNVLWSCLAQAVSRRSKTAETPGQSRIKRKEFLGALRFSPTSCNFTREIESRIATAKAAFNKKKTSPAN